ncbi:MAG: hypothetical protein A2144_14510 [Chloroflexi bacterium RBG_16_50_9]|nr:MAG: hypothetical protein A2144_14510 [Chloroflexi bacterium RBG_16_50_9]
MAEIKVGDRVRIKDRKDWPKPPGYRLANSEGTVVKWIEWGEVLEEFQDYAHVRLEKAPAEANEFIGRSTVFRVENLEKI